MTSLLNANVTPRQFRQSLLKAIQFGTESYPPKIARRLRALNITTWCAAGVGALFAIIQLLDPSPDAWKVAVTNSSGATGLAAIPLFHRFRPWAAPVAFASMIYVQIFVACYQSGTDTGMQMQFLAVAAALILMLGAEYPRVLFSFASAAVALIVALRLFAPHNSGVFPDSTLLLDFLLGIPLTCAILCYVVYYAVREAERAETIAEREYARSEALLANILPRSVASRLKDNEQSVIADRFEDASVLFADMAGFTARTSDTSPDELVLFLNRVFTTFDRLVEQHGLEKIKTTGDAYMVVSGVPTQRPDHAEALAVLALDMQQSAAELRDPHGREVPIRIGIASGPVVAGVVGTRKFFYDVWGDAVNVASRMESTGIPGKIQVSSSIYDCLSDRFVFEDRGEIEVKGKGTMPTWFLLPARPMSFGSNTATRS